MSYLIIATDHDSKEDLRESIREEHRTHLKSAGKTLLGSGALLSDDGNKIIGGFSILDTDDKQKALEFANEDPYSKAGIRKETQVIRWRRRWVDGEFLGDINF
ncbi:MAG: hypothetical protein GY714_25340 [Desulfobacterales bacterium]|nr:hypothetical protein [Desulfobacterales bacterium]MCP4161669.1 hypothetical protein [Deltaproteobacteria bacterium]